MAKRDFNHYARREIETGKKNPMSFTVILRTSKEFNQAISYLNQIVKPKKTKKQTRIGNRDLNIK